MSEESTLLPEEAKDGMNNAIAFGTQLVKYVREKPVLFLTLLKLIYGTMTPLAQVGNINIPDAKTIVIQPWDRSVLGAIEKAIMAANLGFTPVNNGEIIRISIPPLTEERRKEMVKKVKSEGENAKIAVRNIRRNAVDSARKLTKNGIPEDEVKNLEKDIQTVTDKSIEKIDQIISSKEKDIMTV